MYHKILTMISKYDTVIIHRHSSPDGDALGSQIGLKHLIQDTFIGKKVYIVGDEAKRYSFMDGSTMDVIDDEVYKNALAIILDCGAAALISDNRYKLAAASVRFDHHIFAEKIADVEVVDTSYESCCGLITDFAVKGGLRLSKQSAKALYTGMITDSGRFRYDSTNARTLRLASVLMEQEFDTADIYSNLYSDDLKFVKLRAEFVLKIVKPFASNVAYIITSKKELEEYQEKYGVDTFTISRGMVNTMSDIKGIDIWANFTETEDKILVEIRSSKYTVQPVAVKYGGGGHAKACGASVSTMSEVRSILNDLEKITMEAENE